MSAAMESFHAWVVFLDVYGFTSMLHAATHESTRLESQQFAERLLEAQRAWLEFSRKRAGSPLTFLFSDSIFLVYRDDGKDPGVLGTCIEEVARILHFFAMKDLPLRGGIAHGSVTIGPSVAIGAPIIRAVMYEKLVEAPLVLLPAAEIGDAQGIQTEIVPVRDGGKILAKLVAPYPVDEFYGLVERKCKETLIGGPSNVAATWLSVKEYLRRRSEKNAAANLVEDEA